MVSVLNGRKAQKIDDLNLNDSNLNDINNHVFKKTEFNRLAFKG